MQLHLRFTQVPKKMTKTIQEMIHELGLNAERMQEGLKSHPKEVEKAIRDAYDFKTSGHKKKVK